MTFVTLKILEGIEKGKEFSRLTLPITIGRESDSDVQLNDDRISRAHVKLQDHSGRVILTDLGSTNGTRVNGHPVQMRVMQPGDVLLAGVLAALHGRGATLDQAVAFALPFAAANAALERLPIHLTHQERRR